MADTDLAALLAGIRERRELVIAANLNADAFGDVYAAMVQLACVDSAFLLAAAGAVLKLADEAVPALGVLPADCTYACDSGECDCSGKTRAVAWNLDPAKLREAITATLTGEEAT